LLFTYRIGLHQVTPLGVVFLFMLVNWWVEKHQRFLFNVYNVFIFVTFLTFFIFSGTFFTSMLYTSKQAVGVATQYAPAPLLSPSLAAEQTQRSSTFPCRILFHADRCSRLTR